MTDMKRIYGLLSCCLLLVLSIVLSGCGGGGGAPLPAAKKGHGIISARVLLSRPAQLRRSASAATGTIQINISISGYYAEDNTAFTPVTAETEIDLSVGYATVSLVEVPIGTNHLLTVIATYSDGVTETLKCIVPEVVEGGRSEATVDPRSTAIAEAAIALAASTGKNLSQLTQDEVDELESAVDALYLAGVDYSDMTTSDITGYDETATTVYMIEISPATATVQAGGTQQFNAGVQNGLGLTVSDATVLQNLSWSVSGGVGTIGSTGLFTATTSGEGLVVATLGTASGSAAVTVTASSAATAECGNSILETGEGCDDSNTIDGDGCSSTCVVETSNPVCGNNVIETGEGCDNGTSNTETACTPGYNSDCTYCDTSCILQTVAGGYCGDGTVNGSEYCDDGASNTETPCTAAYGATCTYCDTGCIIQTVTGEYCGDATINGTEDCDDGNYIDGDGCQADCTLPPPGISSLDPFYGPNDSAINVTIYGSGFQSGSTVTVGGTAVTSVTFMSTSELSVQIPAGLTVGSHDVVVTNPDGGTYTSAGAWYASDPAGTSHSGTISADEVWTATASPHIVTSTVYVYNSATPPTLTIEAGAVVKFDTGAGIVVGDSYYGYYGKIVADGTASQITLTTNSGSPAAGDWYGIELTQYTQSGTVFNNVVVEYAGATLGTGIKVTGGGHTQIQNCTIRYNSGPGITFMDNSYPASFTGNFISGNTSYPMTVYAEYLRYISSGNTLAGNTTDAIGVYGDTVGTTGTWYNNGVPLSILGNVYIYNSSAAPVITIEAGNTLQFANNTVLSLGDSYYGYPGDIIADGSGGTITFTSAQATPSPGDWQGIVLEYTVSSTTLLNNVVVEYGGYSTTANLKVSSNQPTISNSTIRNSSGAGVLFLDGGGGAGTFTGNTITGNTTNPISIFGKYMQSIPAGNTLTGNGEDVIIVNADTVDTAGTWADNGIPIEVQAGNTTFTASTTIADNMVITFLGDVLVYNSGTLPTLTFGAGDTVKFLNSGITVGETYYSYAGALVADGAGGAITFTSAQATPAAGDWKGIDLTSMTDSSSVLDNVIIEYGGASTGANLTLDVDTVTVANSTIRNSSGAGVIFPDGGGGAGTFTGNTITGNITVPISIFGKYMQSIPAGNTLTGNGEDVIIVNADTVDTAGTWADNGVPIEVQAGNTIFTASTTIADNMTVTFLGEAYVYNSGTVPTLTFGAGDTVQFSGTGLTVGESYYGYYGILVADGTSGTITFTSATGTPSPGDWKGINLTQVTSAGTLLDSVVVEYGGLTNGAGILAQTTNLQLANSTIRNNSGLGVKFPDGKYPASFTNNTITGNTSYPVEIFADYLSYLPSGNTYTGNATDAIKVMADTVSQTGTWYYSGVPFEIQGDLLVYNSSGMTLTIEAGSTLKFLSGAGITVGESYYGYPGGFVADGSLGAITFTSAQATPSPGDWDGITFTQYTTGGSVLNNVEVSYGGANTYGNVYMNSTGSNLTLTNNALDYSSAYGVYLSGSVTWSAPDQSTCTFTGNTSGDIYGP